MPASSTTGSDPDSALSAELLEIICCPACQAGLEWEKEGGLACVECRALYPVVDGIPWLYRDVAGSRAQWAAKLQQFRSDLLEEHAAVEAAAGLPDLLPATHERLARTKAGLERQGQQIFELLEPFAFSHSEAGGGLPRDRVPSQQHVTSYLETAFRDWSWGDAEIRETLALLEPFLPSRSEPARRALVLGGGAGRLSLELARSRRAASVTQLDLNPLLTRIGALAARGRSVALTELPRFPLSVERAAVDHELRAPDPRDPDSPDSGSQAVASAGEAEATGEGGPFYLLGDAFTPPFAPGSVDLLVTPWFIDILPESFRSVARRLGSLMPIGGRWLSFGPLSFESLEVADRFTPDEMLEVLGEAGFEVLASRTETVAYLHSPNNMPRRAEEIFVFSAVRREAVAVDGDFSFYPDWMIDGRLPVPVIPEFERMLGSQTFDLEILKCIDGRASIEDIVSTLSTRYGLAPDRCRNTVSRFFSRTIEGG